MLLLCLSPHGWILENISEITVGHIVLLSVWLAYLKSVFFTLIRNPTRTRWFLLSVKNALILCFKTILLPWMLGCWIDFCTFPLTGATLSQRLEVVSDYPLMAAKHWCVGIGYLLAALSCMKLIQEVTLFHPHASHHIYSDSNSSSSFLTDCSETCLLVPLRCHRTKLQNHQTASPFLTLCVRFPWSSETL